MAWGAHKPVNILYIETQAQDFNDVTEKMNAFKLSKSRQGAKQRERERDEMWNEERRMCMPRKWVEVGARDETISREMNVKQMSAYRFSVQLWFFMRLIYVFSSVHYVLSPSFDPRISSLILFTNDDTMNSNGMVRRITGYCARKNAKKHFDGFRQSTVFVAYKRILLVQCIMLICKYYMPGT